MKKDKVEVLPPEKTMIASPLEDVFGIESNSTESFIQPLSVLQGALVDTSTGEITAADQEQTVEDLEHAREESEIKGQIQNVYDSALGAFEAQSMISQTVDPKFSARNAEVAAQYLNIALHAAKEKADFHFKTAPLKKFTGGQQANTINNNILVADRNEILRALSGKGKDK